MVQRKSKKKEQVKTAGYGGVMIQTALNEIGGGKKGDYTVEGISKRSTENAPSAENHGWSMSAVMDFWRESAPRQQGVELGLWSLQELISIPL